MHRDRPLTITLNRPEKFERSQHLSRYILEQPATLVPLVKVKVWSYQAVVPVHPLRPVRSGQAYRIASAPLRGLVTLELTEALETVFEEFASDLHFAPNRITFT
jgi:hypothetical protein